ncbi:MAG TPA: GNAT family protein [Clostridia bacterium]|nr:GNAT family protein [Clostridia bacterium]
MRLENDKVILRDMIASDADDRVRWQTVETEWLDWDAPWESDPASLFYAPFDETAYRALCAQRLARARGERAMRVSFEICVNDARETHIGWCNSYGIDEEYRFSPTGRRRAIGIDIPPLEARHKGYATAAWTLFIDYFFSQGLREVYTQTWSGNARVLGLIQKLGFAEADCKPGARLVRGEYYDALTFRLDRRAFRSAARLRKNGGFHATQL